MGARVIMTLTCVLKGTTVSLAQLDSPAGKFPFTFWAATEAFSRCLFGVPVFKFRYLSQLFMDSDK